MIRTSLALLFLVLGLLTNASAETAGRLEIKKIVERRARAAVDVFRTHDKNAYEKLCCDEFYEVTSDGTLNPLQTCLDELGDFTLLDYKMTDVVVTVISDTTCLIRYRIWAKYSYQGKELPEENMLATAVWVKRGPEWKAATYQEVKLVDPQ